MAIAAPSDAAYYHRALAAVAGENAALAENMAAHGADQILNKVIRGYAMAVPGNDYSFEQLNSFMTANPEWPGLKGVQMIAEQKLPPNVPSAQIIDWFTAHQPVTLIGFYRYIDALNQSGQSSVATTAIRARWVDNNFSGEEQTAFFTRFSSLLDGNAVWARMDHLLWKNDFAEARRMMPYISANDKMVAEARMALANFDSNADIWLARVPADARNDPGLLFQRLRWRVKNNHDDEADEMLLNPPAELGQPEAWWEERQIMVRRAMERHDFTLAYRLATDHGQTEAKQITQAEFLAGWLALRFLNKPELAREHFQNLLDIASTPVSRARGAYWLGRAEEILGSKSEAEQSYEDAAALNTTYYGQLAATRLYATPTLTAKADPPLPDNVRHAFMNRDIVRAILRLNDIGENDRAHSFFHALLNSTDKRGDFVLLTEIATRLHRPDLAIQTVKAAAQKNMLVENGGYPILNMRAPSPPEQAFTHALIRQESMFSPDAQSGVGARGLMQLMPRTAKDVARKLGMRYRESSLGDPSYNLRLGTSFVQQQIEHFNGSYILALAGYNAGPGRVHEWIQEFGDPRTGAIDPIDWVELIPVQETRNYVQRIMENLQIYRAKLAGGQSPLLILNDLKR